MPDHDLPIFFVHVMKTAGSTIQRNYSPEEIYPNDPDDGNALRAHISLEHLRGLSSERKDRTRVFSGHFPFVATEALGRDVVSMTLLRDPVERAVSHLRQIRRNPDGFARLAKSVRNMESPTFGQLYEDDYLRSRFFVNHQFRMFAITPDDRPANALGTIGLGEERFEIACEQLGRVDVIGLTERYAAVEIEIASRFGWAFGDGARRRVAPDDDEDVDASLRARIEEDNQLDARFYEHARRLVDDRAG